MIDKFVARVRHLATKFFEENLFHVLKFASFKFFSFVSDIKNDLPQLILIIVDLKCHGFYQIKYFGKCSFPDSRLVFDVNFLFYFALDSLVKCEDIDFRSF